MTNKYLFVDTETGGIGLDKSLLSLYATIVYQDDKVWTLGPELSLNVKPDDGIYKVEAGGLDVNKINLVEHDKVAITYRDAGRELYSFLDLWYRGGVSGWEKQFYVPVGHGLSGDLQQIWDKLIRRPTWESMCTYRFTDTSAICKYLQCANKIPSVVSGSLESCYNFAVANSSYYLNQKDLELVNTTQSLQAHTAKGDVYRTIVVFSFFLNLIK